LYAQCYTEKFSAGKAAYYKGYYTQAKELFTDASYCADAGEKRKEAETWMKKCDKPVKQQAEEQKRLAAEQERQARERERQQREAAAARERAERDAQTRLEAQIRAENSAFSSLTTIVDCESFLANYPNSIYIEDVKTTLSRLQVVEGNKYKDGDGVSKDYAIALDYYRNAAASNNLTAYNQLGYMYLQGYGVTQSYYTAYEWFKKAADLGFAVSQNWVGYMCENGYGVTENSDEALEWYSKALENGYKNAQNHINRIKSTVSGRIVEAEMSYGIARATIQVKGTSDKTETDYNGNFKIVLTKPNAILVVSSDGYNKESISVNKGQKDIRVEMKEKFIKQIGVGVRGELVAWNIGDKLGFDYMGKGGLALCFPKNNESFGFVTGLNFGKYSYSNHLGTTEDKKKEIIGDKLSYYAFEVPLTINFNFGGNDPYIVMQCGVQNNFNFGSKYENHFIDYTYKSTKGNALIQPYSLDALVGVGFGKVNIGWVGLTYTRHLTNSFNTNFKQTINGTELYPLKDRILTKNMISLTVTLFFNNLDN
jgi:TPR repeat protein